MFSAALVLQAIARAVLEAEGAVGPGDEAALRRRADVLALGEYTRGPHSSHHCLHFSLLCAMKHGFRADEWL